MLLCIACICDVRTGRIPNLLVVSVVILGGFFAFFTEGWSGPVRWITEMLVYFVLLYPLFKTGVLGAGDVKLMAAVSGVFDWIPGVKFFALVWLIAGIMALAKMLSAGNVMERLEYFFSYVRDVTLTGRWQFYHREWSEAREGRKTIRMTIPLLLGFVLCMGG